MKIKNIMTFFHISEFTVYTVWPKNFNCHYFHSCGGDGCDGGDGGGGGSQDSCGGGGGGCGGLVVVAFVVTVFVRVAVVIVV